MRYASFVVRGRASYGLAVGGGVHDLGVRFGAVASDLKAFLSARAAGVVPEPRGFAERDYLAGEYVLLPPIPDPDKILCVGLNYDEHRRETGRAETEHPSIFTRFADTLVADAAPILLPRVSTALDYEGELAVVIGAHGFRVAQSDAAGMIAGYGCFNDATLRDWQRHTHQFIPGKNFPATGAFGPDIVTPDEVGDLAGQPIETRLNGDVMQSARLGEMIFGVARVIAYVSGFTRLAPGDVIAMGTPGGVGFKRDPQLFMKAGDIVEVSIGGVGRLANPVMQET